MFYSWFYGPKRLDLIRQTLEKEGYVFVTLNELEKIYRESLQ